MEDIFDRAYVDAHPGEDFYCTGRGQYSRVPKDPYNLAYVKAHIQEDFYRVGKEFIESGAEEEIEPIASDSSIQSNCIKREPSSQDDSVESPDVTPASISAPPKPSEAQKATNSPNYERILTLLHHFRSKESEHAKEDLELCDEMIALVRTELGDQKVSARIGSGGFERSLLFLATLMAMMGWAAAIFICCVWTCTMSVLG